MVDAGCKGELMTSTSDDDKASGGTGQNVSRRDSNHRKCCVFGMLFFKRIQIGIF